MRTVTFVVGSDVFVEIRASGPCSSITIMEDPSVTGWPTTDFFLKGTNEAYDDVVRRLAGTSFKFVAVEDGKYRAGALVGYVKAVSGETTFQHIEQ